MQRTEFVTNNQAKITYFARFLWLRNKVTQEQNSFRHFLKKVDCFYLLTFFCNELVQAVRIVLSYD
jgi:hypothetical protein